MDTAPVTPIQSPNLRLHDNIQILGSIDQIKEHEECARLCDESIDLMLELIPRESIDYFLQFWRNPIELNIDLHKDWFNLLPEIESRLPRLINMLLPRLEYADRAEWLLCCYRWLFSQNPIHTHQVPLGPGKYGCLFERSNKVWELADFFQSCLHYGMDRESIRGDISQSRHRVLISTLIPDEFNPLTDLYTIAKVGEMRGIAVHTIETYLTAGRQRWIECLHYRNGIHTTFLKDRIDDYMAKGLL